MDKNAISVKIYNEVYMLQTAASEKQVREVAALVDAKMHELSQKKRLQSTEKIAVWTALDLAAELVELKKRYAELLSAATGR